MIFFPHLNMSQEISTLPKSSSNKITLSLLKYIFTSNNPHPFLNHLFGQFFDDPTNNDNFVSFTKSKNVAKKIGELKNKFNSQNYDLFMLRDFITKNIEHAKEEDREFLINNLFYEINKIDAPETKTFIKSVSKTLKLNKTLLRYAFPKKTSFC
jgi:hypothetical protein